MKCPYCGAPDTTVVDSRMNDDNDVVRRRRRCIRCEKRFTTFERAEIRLPQVVKKDGSRVDYHREKLRGSFSISLRKRPVGTDVIENAITRIEEKLLSAGTREVSSQQLGELVMHELKQIDQIAYIRFASVYRNFQDVDAFSEVIREVAPGKTSPENATTTETP